MWIWRNVKPKYVHVAARNFYSCSIWTEQYALCFITNTKSTCVSAEFTNQFDCYFMSIYMKFLSFFPSFFLSFCSFSYSLNVLHCLPFIDDVTYAVYSQEMTQISTCAYRQILWHICLMHVLYMSTIKSNKYSLNQFWQISPLEVYQCP